MSSAGVPRVDVEAVAREYLEEVISGVQGANGTSLAAHFANAEHHVKRHPNGDEGLQLAQLKDLVPALERAAAEAPAETLLFLSEVRTLRSVLAEDYGVHMAFGYALRHTLGLFEATPSRVDDGIELHP